MLAKSPLFTGIVVTTLALGIGLNTAVFSAVEAILLRPLPGVSQPGELVQVYRQAPGMAYGSLSVPDFMDLRVRSSRAFADVAIWSFLPLAITAGDRPQVGMGQLVSANYFSVLGVRALMGRTFRPDEDTGPGSRPIAVLSYAGWRDRFGSDPSIVGRTVLINGRQMEVVGVTRPDFRSTMPVVPPVAYVPLMQLDEMRPGDAGSLVNRGNRFMTGIARLAPGVTPGAAASTLDAVMSTMRDEFPRAYADVEFNLIRQSEAGIHPTMKDAQVGLSAVVMMVVAILLLIACVNVANLFLARARDRAREMAVRISLGAGRWVLVRQLLTESMLFAVVSGIAALLVAQWAIGLANQVTLPIDVDFRPDLRLSPGVLLFAGLVTVVTGLLFGLAPAIQATRPSLIPALKGESPAGRKGSRTTRSLVVAQAALSIVLLTTAALFLANIRTATRVDTGFVSDGLALGTLDPTLQGYDRARTADFYRRLTDRLRATPGVESMALTNSIPLGLGGSDRSIWVPGYDPRPGEGMSIHYAIVSPGLMETMGIRVLAGRDFAEPDDSTATPAIIVNRQFVDRFWSGQNAIGRTVRVGSRESGRDHTVIGVVPTGKYRRLGEDPTAFMYFAQSQTWSADMAVVLRSSDPGPLLALLRREVAALDPAMPLAGVRTMNEHLGIALMPARLIGTVLGIFGLLGLVLASVGMYGVMAYSVAQRTREIGIRMAIGSSRPMVLGLLMRQGLSLIFAGVVIGIAGAVAASRLIRGLLYGDAPLNPVVFVAVPVLLTLVAAIATFVPARKAASIDPLLALRTE